MKEFDANLFVREGRSSAQDMQAYVLSRAIQVQKKFPDAEMQVSSRLQELKMLGEEMTAAVHEASLEHFNVAMRTNRSASLPHIFERAKRRLDAPLNLARRVFEARVDILHVISADGNVQPSSQNSQLAAIERGKAELYRRPPSKWDLARGELSKFDAEVSIAISESFDPDVASIATFLTSVRDYLVLHSEGRLSGDELVRSAYYLRGRSALIAEQNPLVDEDDS